MGKARKAPPLYDERSYPKGRSGVDVVDRDPRHLTHEPGEGAG